MSRFVLVLTLMFLSLVELGAGLFISLSQIGYFKGSRQPAVLDLPTDRPSGPNAGIYTQIEDEWEPFPEEQLRSSDHR